MALDESGLADAIQAVFDAPPESDDEYSQGLTDAIIAYLGGVEISYPPAPGIMPAAPSPIPDPSFASGAGSPIVPADAQSATLKSAIDASIEASKGDASNWSAADSVYSAVLAAIGASWQTSDGYISSGATVASVLVGFDDTWAQQLGSSAETASDLADRIHTATTAAMFTGTYLKAAFIGPGPHVSALS